MPDDPTTECRCGHQREAHEHYRRGTDCAICGAAECGQFVASTSAAAESMSGRPGS